jgi:hypothetical protein
VPEITIHLNVNDDPETDSATLWGMNAKKFVSVDEKYSIEGPIGEHEVVIEHMARLGYRCIGSRFYGTPHKKFSAYFERKRFF